MSLKLQSFGPIADKHSRVLVLGTMPGAMSLAKRQYYGHPRNAFWPIMARLCDRELPEDYALRKAMLLDAGIALWDVCGECEREGSLDSNICHEKPNRINELLRSYPSIRAIAFNGQGAARLYRKHFGPLASEYGPLILPSTSPAHAVAFDKKLDGWMRLRDLLVPADEASASPDTDGLSERPHVHHGGLSGRIYARASSVSTGCAQGIGPTGRQQSVKYSKKRYFPGDMFQPAERLRRGVPTVSTGGAKGTNSSPARGSRSRLRAEVDRLIASLARKSFISNDRPLSSMMRSTIFFRLGALKYETLLFMQLFVSGRQMPRAYM